VNPSVCQCAMQAANVNISTDLTNTIYTIPNQGVGWDGMGGYAKVGGQRCNIGLASASKFHLESELRTGLAYRNFKMN